MTKKLIDDKIIFFLGKLIEANWYNVKAVDYQKDEGEINSFILILRSGEKLKISVSLI